MPITFKSRLEKASGLGELSIKREALEYESATKYIFKSTDDLEFFASFVVASFNACCGIGIVSQTYVSEPYRNKGIGTILNEFALKICQDKYYGLVLASDRTRRNPAQNKIFNKNNWEDVETFENPNSGNEVYLKMINVVDMPFTCSGFGYDY